MFCLIAPDGVSILRLFLSLLLIILLHRLSANLTALAYIRVVMLTVFVMTLANFIMSVCCPSSAGYQSGLAKVRRP